MVNPVVDTENHSQRIQSGVGRKTDGYIRHNAVRKYDIYHYERMLAHRYAMHSVWLLTISLPPNVPQSKRFPQLSGFPGRVRQPVDAVTEWHQRPSSSTTIPAMIAMMPMNSTVLVRSLKNR